MTNKRSQKIVGKV